MPDPSPLSVLHGLRTALEGARGVRGPEDLAPVLDDIAQAIAGALGYATVAIHLHRPRFDDFEVATVAGGHAAQAALEGKVSTWAAWAPFLTPAFERRGAHHVPAGAVAATAPGLPTHAPARPPAAAPGGWDPADLLVVVLRHANGDVLGILGVDEPAGGRRPGDDAIDDLVTLAHTAALAVEHAREGRRAAAHRKALQRLMAVSARATDRRARGGVLDDVCTGIRDAAGFAKVAVLLAESSGLLCPAATTGWAEHDPVFAGLTFTLAQLHAAFQPANERHGCHLLDHEDARALLEHRLPAGRTGRGGHGPYAWDRHWLFVPLQGPVAEPRGVIWADDPVDRLLPGAEQLQTLRLMADHAARALGAEAHPGMTGAGADHDPLTGLANRSTLSGRLRHALQRTKRSPGTVAVLFIDLDNFKRINDTLGHSAGDELLRMTASRIDHALRPGDTVARFGGDEFVAVCEDVDGAEKAMEVAERLRAILAEPVPLASGVAQVTASIGVALPDRADRSAEMLLQAADRAMYEAKAAGRDAARLGSPGTGWP
ncbi:GGDEF domain-containing protein [Baekduia soli]|uniref:GGDEF domain-containing protein n=1 Tax=Baekduia soli TaxID=496014 RepID=A0A5B8U7X2_9ACTN|nr:GGDEF domain-containing protein [Baekduia soli]QEC49110.1 GGDEF domain-containing protein [Baekduia soli]